MKNSVKLILWIILFGWSCCLSADVFFHVTVNQLEFPDTPPPERAKFDYRNYQKVLLLHPYVVIDGEGEAYLEIQNNPPWETNYRQVQSVVVRVVKERNISGQIFMVNSDASGLAPVKFKIPASSVKPEARQKFHEVRVAHYRELRNRAVPGSAWFRHLEQQSLAELRSSTAQTLEAQNQNAWQRQSEMERCYDLFSGGRAVSENLQLDRLLNASASDRAPVKLSTLTGITVQEMDWKRLVQDIKPQMDPLAACIPADQNALFFPSFKAMSTLISEADRHGTPILQLLEPRSEDARVGGRYQTQICLELSEISRLLGPYVIQSAAFTGSDPYLPTGSDIGILYESKTPELLKTFIIAKQAAAVKSNPLAKQVQGELEGVSYSGAESPDRSLSSYVAILDKVVFISNSRHQLGQMIKATQEKISSLAAQDEYRYFRSRYERGHKEETAFLILPDAAIRRWCGPRWRIMSARRTQAAAILSELQSHHLDPLVLGKASLEILKTKWSAFDTGELRLTPGGIESSIYGSLEFMTPIAEIPIEQVTQGEAEAYRMWRDRYQQNWRQFFDPIAARFYVSSGQLSLDLTVMPLIAGTDYRDWIEITQGSKIEANAGDPHPEALLHLGISINTSARQISWLGGALGRGSQNLQPNPLGWLGSSAALYLDTDPMWQELKKSNNPLQQLEQQYQQLPIALWCRVKNPLGLAAFLTYMRNQVESTAPGMTQWQNLEYNGQPYVKIHANSNPLQPSLYYLVKSDALLLTINEALIKRAIDRKIELAKQASEGKELQARPYPWLGESICLQGNHQGLEVIQMLMRNEMTIKLQRLAWDNLPILNEWHKRYPDQDPVKIHEKIWNVRLICPIGGSYVWNEKWQTMESTVAGHPGEPKPISAEQHLMPGIKTLNFGVTFENQSLRAKTVLERN